MDWPSVASAALALLLYYNTLDAGFVYDDRRAVFTNPDVIGAHLSTKIFQNDFWGTALSDPGSHGSYRPLCVATFHLNYLMSGLKPWSYHMYNILLHCLATALVVRVAKKLMPRKRSEIGAFIAGLSFAAHPIHTEAVAGIVGRADLLACILFLFSFLCYVEHVDLRSVETIKFNPTHVKHKCMNIRLPDISENEIIRISCHSVVQQIITNFKKFLFSSGSEGPLKLLKTGIDRRSVVHLDKPRVVTSENFDLSDDHWKVWSSLVVTVLLAIASTLCKEPGVTVLPVCIIYDIIRGAQDGKWRAKERMLSICVLGASTLIVLIGRWLITGGAPVFVQADNPTAKEPDYLTRLLTFAYLPVLNFMLLIWPTTLSFDWSMDAVPRVKYFFEPRSVLSLTFYYILYRVINNCRKNLYKDVNSIKLNNEKPVESRKKSFNRRYRYYNSSYEIKRINYNESRDHYRSYRDKLRERSNYKQFKHQPILCSSIGCKQTLTDDHSANCRVLNNNNIMTVQSVCACVKNMRYSVIPEKKERETSYRSLSSHACILLALSFLIVPFIPATNLLFYVGFVVAERVLYIPSVGYCLLLGIGAQKVCQWKINKYWRNFLIAAMLVAFSAKTLRRNLDWRDEESLFRSAINVNPAKAYGNLGSVLSSQLRHAEAEIAFRKALSYRPNMADVHYNLGILLHSEKRYHEAIQSFEMAIHFRPSMALAYVNLGVALIEDGRLQEAARVLRAGSSLEGKTVRDRREHEGAKVSALVQLAGLHFKRKQLKKALATYREALEALPPSQVSIGWNRHNILSMIGETYAELKQWHEAEIATREALAVEPLHTSAHLFLATLLARNSTRALEAEQWFRRAVSLSPDHVEVRHYFGEFLMSRGRADEAAEHFVKAAELVPNAPQRAATAARALREAGQCERAEYWYKRVVKLSPLDSEAHANLGAILHRNGKYTAAASAYRKALKIQPKDDIVMENINRLRNVKSAESF